MSCSATIEGRDGPVECDLADGHDGPHQHLIEWEDSEPWVLPPPCPHPHPIERVTIGTGIKSMYCLGCGESWA